MLHFLLNLCAFCRAQHQPQRPHRLPQHGQQGRRTTDTARERPALPHAVGEHDTPSTPARWTRRPPPLCCQLARPDQTDRASRNARTSEEGERRARSEKGRKDEDLRPLACRFAVKVIYRPNPALNGQPSTTPGQQAPQPAPAEAPSLPTYSRPFLSLSILLLESLQNPGPFSPVSRRTTAPRPPAWTPSAPGEPSHFRARPVSHETAQYLYSITYTPYPHFSLGNNLDDSPTVNELNPYLQNHIFSLTTSVFLSTLYNSLRLQSYSSPIATKKTNILIDFRPQIW